MYNKNSNNKLVIKDLKKKEKKFLKTQKNLKLSKHVNKIKVRKKNI